MRVYTVDRKGAVRIVYQRGFGGYYGIQQTSVDGRRSSRSERDEADRWAPPIASTTTAPGSRWSRSRRRGRVLGLNTLLGELSNETMLAIAKGLKPLASVK